MRRFCTLRTAVGRVQNLITLWSKDTTYCFLYDKEIEKSILFTMCDTRALKYISILAIIIQSEDPSLTPYRCLFFFLTERKHRGFVCAATHLWHSVLWFEISRRFYVYKPTKEDFKIQELWAFGSVASICKLFAFAFDLSNQIQVKKLCTPGHTQYLGRHLV